MKEWNSRTKYCYAKLNKETWWVTLSPEENAMTYSPLTKHPKFRRVRVLNAVHGANDKTYLCCTCKTRERCGYVCRHILSVVGDLTPKMVALRWHKSYAFLFGAPEQDEVTHQMRQYIDHVECHGVPVEQRRRNKC